MNQWSRTRRRNALLIVLAFLVVVIAVPLYFFFQVTPTCFDNKQNGDETGVDCGGSCTTLCGSESLPIISKGDPRVLQVASSTYEAVAYVQNPNATGMIVRASYVFKLYEASSTVPVKTITNSVYVPKNATFAVFEGPFDMGDKKPVRATFTWDTSTLNWVKDASASPDIAVTDAHITQASSTPRADATIENRSLADFSNIYLVSLVFDNTGTIAAASKTYVDTLGAGESAPVSFIWPEPFSFAPASIQIIPTVLPDSSYIR